MSIIIVQVFCANVGAVDWHSGGCVRTNHLAKAWLKNPWRLCCKL